MRTQTRQFEQEGAHPIPVVVDLAGGPDLADTRPLAVRFLLFQVHGRRAVENLAVDVEARPVTGTIPTPLRGVSTHYAG